MSTQDTTLPLLEQERKAFETWAKHRAHPFHDREPLLNNGSIDRYSDIAWQAWQARASLVDAKKELQQIIADSASRAAFLDSHPTVTKELCDLIEENERLRAQATVKESLTPQHPHPIPRCSDQAILHALDMAKTESHGQGDRALHLAFGRAMWRQFNAMLCISGPQPSVMVDMSPPATARERWIYEQGRLAERDPRTRAAEQAQGSQTWTEADALTLCGHDGDGPIGQDDVAQMLRLLRAADQLREQKAEALAPQQAQGVPASVPRIATPEMRARFREAYRDGGFWSDRLDYALDQMLAAAPQAEPKSLAHAETLANALATSLHALALRGDNGMSPAYQHCLKVLEDYRSPAPAPHAEPQPELEPLTDEQIDELRSRYTDKLESREDIRTLLRKAFELAGIGTKGGAKS